MKACRHNWSMHNIQNGYLTVEGCTKCGARYSFFSKETVAPVEEYQEGEHYWISFGNFQAVKFDLRCTHCKEIVSLDNMMGLMLSTCEKSDCNVGKIVKQTGPNGWVYVALCADSSHSSGKCIGDHGIQALNEYFNQNIKVPGKKIIVVPCKLCDSVDTCQGTVLADIGLTDFYDPMDTVRRRTRK